MGGKRIKEDEAAKIVESRRGQATATITKLEKKEEREKPQLLYDLTSLQRHANTLFGFSARRTLGAAQKLYEEHKAITYPRTNSRYLTGRHGSRDQADVAELVGPATRSYKQGRRVRRSGSTSCRWSASSTTRRSRTTTRSSRRSPSTTCRRWAPTSARSTTSSPSASWRSSTPTPSSSARASRPPWQEHVFRTSGRVLLEAGWRRSTARRSQRRGQREDDSGGDQLLPKLEQGEEVDTTLESSRCARRRSRRGASPRPRCSARWRPPARTSRTTSCARR